MVRETAHDPALRGRVIPLAFHVDYWNHLGWRDPFSSADWSRRQMFYTRAMNLPSAYTPQMIVNGSRQFVGSNRHAFEEAIADASARKAEGSIELTTKRIGDTLEATVSATVPHAARPSDVWVAIAENEIATKVAAGENAGMTIDDDAIVRRLIRVDTVDGGATRKTIAVPIDKQWGAITAVAFVQERGTMAIRCATMAR